jgi:glycosyltransferase involved in cell wall biosynthesis
VWATLSEESEKGRGLARRIVRTLLLRQAHAVLVNGRSGQRYVRGLTRHCPETFMAPYATDTDVFGTREKRAEPGPVRKLLSVGQLIPRKGLREFATALGWWTQAHPDIGVEWKLAGDGPLRQEFLSLPHPPSLRVEHVGAVGYERLPELYSASDVLVLPSLADEWAVVVNEAMASGLPVLGSVCSQAVQELVEDGKTGWTFHPQRPPEMQATRRASGPCGSRQPPRPMPYTRPFCMPSQGPARRPACGMRCPVLTKWNKGGRSP